MASFNIFGSFGLTCNLPFLHIMRQQCIIWNTFLYLLPAINDTKTTNTKLSTSTNICTCRNDDPLSLFALNDHTNKQTCRVTITAMAEISFNNLISTICVYDTLSTEYNNISTSTSYSLHAAFVMPACVDSPVPIILKYMGIICLNVILFHLVLLFSVDSFRPYWGVGCRLRTSCSCHTIGPSVVVTMTL